MFEQAFRNIDDVLRKEAGCTTELDYTEQTSWLLFFKMAGQAPFLCGFPAQGHGFFQLLVADRFLQVIERTAPEQGGEILVGHPAADDDDRPLLGRMEEDVEQPQALLGQKCLVSPYPGSVRKFWWGRAGS